jgi:hypothetical protein
MGVKDRLLELIEFEGLNPNQFYVKTGLGKGFLDKVGQKLKRPSVEKISATFPSWNVDYLQTGEGDKLRPLNHQDISDIPNNTGVVGIQGSGNQIHNAPVHNTPNFEDILALLQKKDEQIDKMIGLFESQKEQINKLIKIIDCYGETRRS